VLFPPALNWHEKGLPGADPNGWRIAIALVDRVVSQMA
jgi:hypothetical protein